MGTKQKSFWLMAQGYAFRRLMPLVSAGADGGTHELGRELPVVVNQHTPTNFARAVEPGVLSLAHMRRDGSGMRVPDSNSPWRLTR